MGCFIAVPMYGNSGRQRVNMSELHEPTDRKMSACPSWLLGNWSAWWCAAVKFWDSCICGVKQNMPNRCLAFQNKNTYNKRTQLPYLPTPYVHARHFIIGDIAERDFAVFAYWYFGIDVTVPWSVSLCVCVSVCLSRSCIVLKRQKISAKLLRRQLRVSQRSWLENIISLGTTKLLLTVRKQNSIVSINKINNSLKTSIAYNILHI